MLSRFHLIPERHGRTDRIAMSVSRVSVLTRDKNRCTHATVYALLNGTRRVLRTTIIILFAYR